MHGSSLAQPLEPVGDTELPGGLDYDQSNIEWNGLSELRSMLEERGITPIFDQPVDLAALTVDSPLILIYPRVTTSESDLRVDDLLAFLADGGRLLLADDYGEGGLLSSALGVFPRWGRLPHRQFFRSNDQLPTFWVHRGGELLAGVVRIVANHPVALESDQAPVIGYDEPGFGLLYDLVYGQGRALILGDPSLFINFMLEVADSRRLVGNLFEALCSGLPRCSPRILTGQVRFEGQYRGQMEEPGEGEWSVTDRLRGFLGAIGATIEELPGYRPDSRGVYYTSLVLALGIMVFLFTLLPLSRPGWLSFTFRLPRMARCRSEYEQNLLRHLREVRGGDLGLPLAILKEEFEDLFYGQLGREGLELDAGVSRKPEELRRIARWYGERVASGASRSRRRAVEKRALATLEAVSRVTGREMLVPQVKRRHSRRLFLRLYRDTSRLLHELGVDEEYERRTGQPNTDRS
ncbi:MAG: DUF4350 domain-containing protein [Bradymonadales bacterium]|nr:DUF4350 domain-containing protein [Bradymonadales bacterium]